MLKPLVPKFRSNISFCFREVVEKQVPVKLKLTLFFGNNFILDSSKSLTYCWRGAFRSPLRFFVCHCETAGASELKLSHF